MSEQGTTPGGRTRGVRSFGERLADVIEDRGRLCVGIDPHAKLLDSWGLRDDVDGLREFSLRTVEALAGTVAALKPQTAFYERHGSAGIAVLEETIAAARAAGVLSIVDAKRGDIGSTMQGYADAYLRADSPLAGDAVTLSPYLGFGSLTPAVDTALANGRGVFVLCLTTNPEGASVQLARGQDGRTVAADVAQAVAEVNAVEISAGGDPGATQTLGSVGLVVGATIGDAARRGHVDLVGVRGPLLMPGIGAQGGDAASVRGVVGEAWYQVLANSSREVLGAGPDADSLRGAARSWISSLR